MRLAMTLKPIKSEEDYAAVNGAMVRHDTPYKDETRSCEVA